MTFAEKLRMQRKRLGYTQSQLADVLGITTRTLINYEMGRCCPNQTEVYMKMASVFGVRMEDLITDMDCSPVQETEQDAAKEVRRLLARMSGLFAGGELCDEDRDKVMYAVTDMYWKAKARK